MYSSSRSAVRKTLAMAAAGLLAASSSFAAVIYVYTGNSFSTVGGDFPQVTTSDSVSGFVTFSDDPTPQAVLRGSDIVSFSLSDGARTLSSANGDPLFGNPFFVFDDDLNISRWNFVVIPNGPDMSNSENIETIASSPTFRDYSRIRAGFDQNAFNNNPGTWAAVPEPSVLGILAAGVLGMAILRMR